MSAPAFVETHCHLNHPQFAKDLDATLDRARGAGIGALVVIGCDIPSSQAALALAHAHPNVYATVGFHPHEAMQWNAEGERALRKLATESKVVALGEMGLDFYRDLSPRDAQYVAFRAQLDLAAELGLPIVVHTRESVTPSLDLLEPYARAGLRGVMHCWSGTLQEAERALELGFTLGVGGVLTYKKAGELPDAVRIAPMDRLVLETDCPYLTPMPHRSKRNEPSYIPLVAAHMAMLRGTGTREIAEGTTAAARDLFRLPDTTL